MREICGRIARVGGDWVDWGDWDIFTDVKAKEVGVVNGKKLVSKISVNIAKAEKKSGT